MSCITSLRVLVLVGYQPNDKERIVVIVIETIVPMFAAVAFCMY